MSEKEKPPLMSVGLKLSLAFCHQCSQGLVLGPLLFTVTLCTERFISSKSIHSILSPMPENKYLIKPRVC